MQYFKNYKKKITQLNKKKFLIIKLVTFIYDGNLFFNINK